MPSTAKLIGHASEEAKDHQTKSTVHRLARLSLFLCAVIVIEFLTLPVTLAQLAPATKTTLSVATSGTPSIYGTAVTFTATVTSGATGSITFYDGSTSLGSSTIQGTTAILSTSALTAGSHSITAYFPGSSKYKSVTSSPITQTVNKATPVISWPSPSPITYGTALSASQLNATANTPGTFIYSPGSGTVLNSGTQSLSTIFTPTDTTDFNSATKTVSLTVNKATPSLVVATSGSPASYGVLVTFSATISSGPSGSITFYDGGNAFGVGTISGTTANSSTSGLSVGSHTITAGYSGSSNYNAVTSGPITQTINRATPVINWTTPAPITYGTSLSATQLNATANVPGTFAYSPATGTVLGAGSRPLSVTFTPTDSVDYTSSTAGVTLVVNKALPIITWPAPASIQYGTALSATQLNASSPVAGSFAYTPGAGTVLSAGAQALSTTFTPTDSADYSAATAAVTITVTKAAPAITWPAPAPITYGTALSPAQLDATSTVPGTFAYTPSAGTVLGAGSQTLSTTFTPTDTNNYSVATSSAILTVNKAAPAITWASPAPITYGAALTATQLNASSNVPGTFVYSPASGVIPSAGSQTLSTTFTPSDTANYTTALGSVVLVVNKAIPVITWPVPTPISYGTPLGTTQLDASSSTPGSFAYTPASGTILSAGSQSLSVAFTPTDTADYGSATASVSLAVNKANPVISWPTPAPITYGTALDSTELNASTTTAGSFVYTPTAGAVLNAGSQTLSTTFMPADTSNYTSGAASVVLTVNKATPAISWSSPVPITYGTPLGSTQLNASSTVPGSFNYVPAAGTVLTAGSQSLTVTLTPTDSSDYNTASASVSLMVNPAVPTVSWSSPAAISYGTPLGATQLNASASVPGTFSYSPPAGTVLPVGTQTLSVTFAPTDSTDYSSATQSVSIVVNQLSFTLPGPGLITTMAGNGIQGYIGDGAIALNAELNQPSSIAVDQSGNAYIADTQNNVIREVLASNNQILTVAGNGTAGYAGDGATARSAQLSGPTGVALDSTGNLYIADTKNNCIRLVNLANGIINTFAGNGTSGYSGDGGNPSNAQLNAPVGLTIDSDGSVYIADSANNVVRKVASSGTVISTVAGTGIPGSSGDGGLASNAELNHPTSVALDSAGNLYIADTLNLRIRKVTISNGAISAFAGNGQFGFAGDGGPALSAELSQPTGLAIDANGNLYITDVGNSVVREVFRDSQQIKTIAGNLSWGYSGDGGPATSAQLAIDQVDAVATDSAGNLYIADTDNNVIRVVGGVKSTPTLITSASPVVVPAGAVSSTFTASVSSGTGSVTFSNGAGWSSGPIPLVNYVASYTLNGAGWAAGTYTISANYSGDALDNPASGSTSFAVSTTAKATPTITWPTPAPINFGTAVSAVQLNATSSVPGTFQYSLPPGTVLPVGANTLSVLFLPTDGADYNAVTANVTLTVSSSSWALPAIGAISTIAGDGTIGYSGDGNVATKAELTMFQSGIAVDAAGDIYIADWQNNIVRKVNATSGQITTIAGNGSQGYSGDNGPATSAELNSPAGVGVDAIGNVYIADAGNNVIREISAETSVITTIAGNGVLGYSGDNGPAVHAALYYPVGLAVSARGDLYVAEMGNSVIRKIAAGTGTITTVVGTGISGYTGDNAPARSATLNGPSGIAIDQAGNLYIADLGNNSLRAVFASGNIPAISNPVSGNIYTLVGNGSSAAINATLNDAEGVAVDQSGNIYIADGGDNQIREVYSAGFIPNISNPTVGQLYTVAGNGVAGYQGDGGPATSAALNGPIGVAIDGTGHIYIADSNNQVVRAIGTPSKSQAVISWPTPAALTYGTALDPSRLNATSSIPGTLIYEPPLGTVLLAGTQLLGVTFTPNDTADYATVTSTSSMTVNKGSPVITWATPPPIMPGTALGAAQLNAQASVPGIFTYSPGAGTIPPLGPLTINVTFTPTDGVDYATASTSVTTVVEPIVPTITWPAPAPITYGTALSSAQLFATASVPGSFTFNPPVGTLLPAGTATLTATFTPNNTVEYATASASVQLVVNKATPVIAWPTPSAITTGTPLSSVQLNATTNVAGTFVYNPEIGFVPSVGTTTLNASFTPADSTDYVSSSIQVQLAVNSAPAPGSPILELRTSPTPNSVTLSNSQNLDWITWATSGSTPVANRMSGAGLISDITALSSASLNTDLNGQVAYSWTDGAPTASGTGVNAETYTAGTGAGFQITAPADASVKTLLLYANVNANAQLTASISDGSSPVVVHAPTTTSESGNQIYAIDYRAASSGQTITVQLVATDSSANVGLQAAVLRPHLPDVAVLSPVPSQAYPLTGVPVIVNASQFDSSVSSVQLIVNGTNSTLLTGLPFQTTLALPAGHYSIVAQAVDSTGLTNISAPVEFDVVKAGGTLSDSFTQLGDSMTDLTAEGTADWTTFAPAAYGQTQVERKGGVVPQVSDFTLVGSGMISEYSAIENFNSYNRAIEFSYEDGAPDKVESGIFPETYLTGYVAGNPGYQFTVPADTNPRTLRLYAQNCGSDVQMTAFLSDGSAPPILDNSLTDSIESQEAFYAINYAAATPGQTLTVRLLLTGQNNGSWGMLPGQGVACLTAATLAGGQAAPPTVTAITPASGIAGTTVTVSGDSFGSSQGSGTVTINGTALNVLSWGQGSIQAVLPAQIETGPVQVTTASGSSNSDVIFTVAPTVTSVSPSVGPVGTTVTISGVGLGSSQGQGTVSFNGIPAAPSSWTDTQITVPVPFGATTGRIAVTQGAPASVAPLFVVTSGIQGSPSPVLHVRLDRSPMTVNLSDPANLDWVVWRPANSPTSTVRKAGANLISDITPLNSTSIQSDKNGIAFSWTGGSPTATGVSQAAGIYGYSYSGTPTYQITAPADTTVKTLKLYCFTCGYYHVNASLSDGSIAPVTYTPEETYDYGERVFSIDYRAASAGQTLTVQIVSSPIKNFTEGIQLEAAVLEPHVPEVSILSPIDGQELPAGTVIPFGVDAWQFDSSVNSLAVSANGSQLFSLAPPTTTANWTPQPGHYTLQAQVADAQGLSHLSKGVAVDIIGTGGELAQTNSAIPQNVDLTSQGTADWIMFAYCGTLPYYGEIRKDGVKAMISDFKIIGDEFGQYYPWGDNGVTSTFSFADGTPAAQDSTIPCGQTFDNGVPGNGFELNVDADTTPRTLYLYVASWQSRGKLRAFLSDGSAPVISDTSVASQIVTSNYGSAVYAVRFHAASPGQKLTVQWTSDAVFETRYNSDGYTELYAVALDGPPSAASGGPVVASLTPESGGVGTLVTIKGSGFGASQGSSTVTFNGQPATPISWSDTEIQVPAPLADNTGYLEVTVNGVSTQPVIFNMPPTITSLSCSFCAAGAAITINGYNFGSSQVRFSYPILRSMTNGAFNSSPQVTSWTDTQIQVVMPSVPDYWGTQMTLSVEKSDPFSTGSGESTSNQYPFSTSSTALPSIVQWAPPATITYGTPLSSTLLNATASVPGTFTYSPSLGAVLGAGTQTLTVTFTPTDNISYTTATAQVPLQILPAIPSISWPTSAQIVYGTSLSPAVLNATASVPGTFVYTPAAGATPIVGINTLTVNFTPDDSVDYTNASATTTLVVTPGAKGIEIPPVGVVGPLAGGGLSGSAGDGGDATGAQLSHPFGIAVDSSGNVYIADTENNVVREINAATGVISVIAGSYQTGYSGDNGPAALAELNAPEGVAVDLAGNLYIADSGNNAVRLVQSSTGNILTLAGDGTGTPGYAGDGGSASSAQLSHPTSVAVDNTGNVYIADRMNNAIRRVDAATGTISTIAGDTTGMAGYAGDSGPASSALFNHPFGVAVDISGNIYVSDSNNHRVREINASTGVITTIAGNGSAGYSGDNGAATSAELALPLGIATDGQENVFFADSLNNAIREVPVNSNVITTVAGYGLPGYSGDGGLGTRAQLNGPVGVATDVLMALKASRSLARVKGNAVAHPLSTGSNGGGGNNPYFCDAGNNACRVEGNPTQNTPGFHVPDGQYLAWAFPGGSTPQGDVTVADNGTAGSASFYGPGQVKWTGFYSGSLPTLSPYTVKGVYAVAAYTATSLNNLAANLTSEGQTLNPPPLNGIGVSQTQLPGTSVPPDITATLTGSGLGSLNVTSAAVAITYTIPPTPPSPPGSCENGGSALNQCNQGRAPCPSSYATVPDYEAGHFTVFACCPPGSTAKIDGVCTSGTAPTPPDPTYDLALVDPDLPRFKDQELLSPQDVIAASVSGPAPLGIIADGTSTAIAVLKIDPQGGPPPTGTITFTVNNGATVAPWDPWLPSTPPGPLSTSDPTGLTTELDVPAANLIASGGSYYALALVTSGTPSTTNVGQQIRISSTSGGSNLHDQYLTAYQPPTVLIHGLWGNQSSLKSTKKYLISAGYPFVYTPCYSQYLAYWYTGDDPLPDAGKGCELTATQAIDKTLKQVYSDLDGKGIVGGRVDVVAHSMGGLVTRFYATSPGTLHYYNYRNRNQGTFRDIVTLDTPETGSPLAWYLDNVIVDKQEDPSQYYDLGYQSFPRTKSALLWKMLCGDNHRTTYRTCTNGTSLLYSALMYVFPQPLAPPQDADILLRGSVASLIPGESHLLPGSSNSLPDPNLPNATWYAVASDYQAAGSSVPSDMEQFLNTFSSALYHYPIDLDNPPLSLRYMMTYPGNRGLQTTCPAVSGFMDNDIIVPVCSQTWHAVPGQTAVCPGLAHAAAGPWGAIKVILAPLPSANGDKLGPSSSAYVTDSQPVNQLVDYWLSARPGQPPSCSGNGPQPMAIGSELAQQTTPVSEKESQLVSADERLTIPTPIQTLELAHPFKLQLTLTDPNVSSIAIVQGDGKSALENRSAGKQLGDGEAKIVEDDGLSKSVEVVPLQVGTVRLGVFVRFRDGGIAMKTVELNVVPSPSDVKAFHLDQGFSTIPLEITNKSETRQHWLFPEVEYENLEYPISLRDSMSVTMWVDQPENNPVIKLDRNGMIHALRPGTARITGTFAGMQDTVVVTVRATKPVR